ncbi:hypothetical protein QA601_14750 [Chitinispirillales bacterium ANBcel5]|uniref:hypothetical protein n=1 Tax=Cellulosispirillum alkaliphilum TaxID=3039283 RepID=UPI002A4E488E|nr:hypothetical protein [Chitinispirillales bacterium ANBcel5]
MFGVRSFFIAINAVSCLAAGVCAETKEEHSFPEINIHGNIQIQARKELYDNGATDNLDQFWGRANLGVTVRGEALSGRINIRAFPAGFGFEVLTGATFDTTGQGSVTGEKTGIPNFQIENAWIQHTRGNLSTRVGRFSHTTSQTLHFGNYLYQDPGGRFMARIAYFNALELSAQTGPLLSSVIFAAGDRNLNTGSLRIFEKLTIAENLNIGVGYFANIFDLVHNSDAEIINRFTLTGDYTLTNGLMPYLEVGIIENGGDNSWDVPLTIGCKIPAGTVVDFLALEMEYSPETIREDNPVGVNLALVKRFNNHASFNVGISSSTYAESFGDLAFGVRYTGSL